MKFLLINYEYPPIGGGAATATQAIARNLVSLGYKVTVLTAGYRGLPGAQTEEGVLVRRVKCFRKHADRCTLFEMASFVLSALVSLRSIVAADQPAAGIAFFSIPCGPIALAARILFGLPYVISLRGGDVPGLTPEVHQMHRFLRLIRRIVLKSANAIVANADSLRKLAEKNDPFQVLVIHNGVDTEFFSPMPNSEVAGAQPFRIVFTGRFQAQKNVSLLLDQCAALRVQSDKPFELHLVGDGPLRAELERQVICLGLSDRVIWHGWTPREQLREIYRKSDCFVNPSFYEGMPNAILEAMACGKPIIASCVGGNDAVVQHGCTGFLFPLDKPAALLQFLRTLMEDRVGAQRMGQKGREWAKKAFSWNTAAAAYAGLF